MSDWCHAEWETINIMYRDDYIVLEADAFGTFLLVVEHSNEADISYFCLLAILVLFLKECV